MQSCRHKRILTKKKRFGVQSKLQQYSIQRVHWAMRFYGHWVGNQIKWFRYENHYGNWQSFTKSNVVFWLIFMIFFSILDQSWFEYSINEWIYTISYNSSCNLPSKHGMRTGRYYLYYRKKQSFGCTNRYASLYWPFQMKRNVIHWNFNHFPVFASISIACPINCLDALFSKTEFMHMFSITAPKTVFCDCDVYGLVRECLTKLENDASVFTIDGTTDDSTSAEQIFDQTPEENDFS